MKQTPLYSLHLELGAKMSAFAGYQMPIHYPRGIIHEHLHCRSLAGFFDISHMGQCLISGDSAADALERLTPSDIAGLKTGQQKYTVLTNDEGGIIDDIIVTRLDAGLRIVVNAACKEKDYDYLSERIGDRCRLIDLPDRALVALQGPASDGIMRKFSSAAAGLSFMQACETKLDGIQCTVSRAGYTGEDGFEISVSNQHAEELARLLLNEHDVSPVGLGARDTLRLEAGLCLYGHDLSESITPVEAGLKWLIKKGRSDFPGAARINRQLQQGPDIIRTGLIVQGKLPVREGSAVLNDQDAIVGRVTSGGFSPSLGRPIAMAQLANNHAALGTCLYANVREHRMALTVASLPFIQHRYRK